MLNFLSKIITYMKDLCFPPTCYICNTLTETNGICVDCWKNISWIENPKCKICGVPFTIAMQDICADCEKKRPQFDKAISVFVYDKFSKKMILYFKNYDGTYMAEQFAQWMYRVSKSELVEADLIIPVPITMMKRISRKYNQAELLAMALSDLCNVTYEPRILKKIKTTKQQEGLTRKMRQKNLVGSFGVDEKFAHLLKDKNIILIDDVITTGSTANECAKTLKKHGAKTVTVLTIARTIVNKVEI